VSTGPQSIFGRTQEQAVLDELLHSLSQPLTTLRCSLELSVEDIVGQQQAAVSAALQQTDRVIGVVRLMREYLDTEPATVSQPAVPLGPVLRNVVEQLFSVAEEKQVRLKLTGGCSATIVLAEPRLRLALQYLLGVFIEMQPRHGDLALRLEQGSSESELRADGASAAATNTGLGPDAGNPTLHHVRLAIACRLLESAGTSLEFRDDTGFVLRVPRPPRPALADPFL
jgi:signal transduction histidine kinase